MFLHDLQFVLFGVANNFLYNVFDSFDKMLKLH